jgi:hypothetical protein
MGGIVTVEWWNGKDWEGNIRGFTEYYPRICKDYLENHEKPLTNIFDIMAEVRTEHLPNTSP